MMADCWFVAVWLFGINMYHARHIRIPLDPEPDHIIIYVIILCFTFYMNYMLVL